MAEPLTLNLSEVPLSAANTAVEFCVRWFGVLTVRGHFERVSGSVHIPDGDAARASVHAEVALDSLRTGIALRDRHLRGPNFFDVARHRVASFRGGSVLRWPTYWVLPGSLTIRGQTSTEELTCALEDDGDAVVVRAVTSLDRRRFGVGVVRGLRALDPLFALIGDEVRLEIVVRLPAGSFRPGPESGEPGPARRSELG